MRQKNIYSSAKERKFEDGMLRVDACMERYSTSRDSQYRTSFEDLPSYSFGSSAVREERRLMRDVHRLISAGFVPQAWESLEEFVQGHSDVLEEVI
ncbi:MAG: hypothetical protein AB1629_01095 [Candidatus Omnitrophota bacterium]